MFSITHAHFLLLLPICLFVLWVKGEFAIRSFPKPILYFLFVLTPKVFFFLSGFVAVSVHLRNRDRNEGFIRSLKVFSSIYRNIHMLSLHKYYLVSG